MASSVVKWISLAKVAQRARERLAPKYGALGEEFDADLADALAHDFTFLFTFKAKMDELRMEVGTGGYGALSIGNELTDLGRLYRRIKQLYDTKWLSQFDIEGDPLE